jgi:hypothetical protein
MNYKKLMGIVLSLLIVTVIACSSIAQKPAETTKPEGPQMTIKGKIDYNKSMGGYFVRGLEPGGELFIVNQDTKVLDDLMKSGKTLTIEGRIVRGAEYLFIEKIDGKKYLGKQ